MPPLLAILLLADCERSECFTPPSPVVLEFLDTNGQNLIQNGRLKTEDIRVQLADGHIAQPELRTELGQYNRVQIHGVGWADGTINFKVQLNLIQPVVFGLGITSAPVPGKCGGRVIQDVQISQIQSVKEQGYYKIIVAPEE